MIENEIQKIFETMNLIIKDSDITCSNVIWFLGIQRYPNSILEKYFETIFQMLEFSFKNEKKIVLDESFRTLEYFLENFKLKTILNSEFWIFKLIFFVSLEDDLSIKSQKILESQEIFESLYKPDFNLTLKKLSKIIIKEIKTESFLEIFSKINVKSMKILGYCILLVGNLLKKMINDINPIFEVKKRKFF